MNRNFFIDANVAVAVIFVCMGLYGRLAAHTTGDQSDALVFVTAGMWFALISVGHAAGSRVLVTVTSVPAVIVGALYVFVLLFAPLAWGDSNAVTAYALQAVGLLLIVVQIAGLIAVFYENRMAKGTTQADRVTR